MTKLRAFCMPKWGIEMTEGTLAEWQVKEGDSFSKGDLLCLIETDKITNEVQAERDGVLAKIVVEAGGEAEQVGTLLAVLADGQADAGDVDQFVTDFKPTAALGTVRKKSGKNEGGAKEAPAATPKPAPALIDTNRPISPKALELASSEGVDLSTVEGSGKGGRITLQDIEQAVRPERNFAPRGTVDHPAEDLKIYASPLARRIASMEGIDLSSVKGTGPRGRICKKDVLALVDTSSGADRGAPFRLAANNADVKPFDKIRKVVARRLTQAKQEIPHFYLRSSFAADELLSFRKTANLVLGRKASVNDYIVFACGKALAKHPDINVQLHGEELHHYPHADVAVAVAGPSGLVTPIVRQANRMRIDQLAEATSALIEKAREGRLSYEDLDGGTFTVSNLGMFGIENFDAIINPPQAAILAVGKADRCAVEKPDGSVGFETRISMTLSVDHRAIDGAAGAGFLQTLKEHLEAPETLFA